MATVAEVLVPASAPLLPGFEHRLLAFGLHGTYSNRPHGG